MNRNPWPSLLMLVALWGSTAYALTEAMLTESAPAPPRPVAVEIVLETHPVPTDSELSTIRRALLPKIEVSEPLLVQAS